MRRRRAVIAQTASAVLSLQSGGWLLHGIGAGLLRRRRRIVIIVLIIREVLLVKVVIQKAFQVQVMLIGLAKLIGFGIDADQPAMR